MRRRLDTAKHDLVSKDIIIIYTPDKRKHEKTKGNNSKTSSMAAAETYTRANNDRTQILKADVKCLGGGFDKSEDVDTIHSWMIVDVQTAVDGRVRKRID